MDNDSMIERTATFVRSTCEHDASGHDWWHIKRVWQTARTLAATEKANGVVVDLAALLHDVDDWKIQTKSSQGSTTVARNWLAKLPLTAEIVEQVCQVIESVSYKGSGVATPVSSIEAAIVQDADRLDAIGAIGVARTFAYGGHKGQPLFDPSLPPTQHQTFEHYKNNRCSTINHFFEKLLLLRDRLNTDSARRFAESRHQFMIAFLNQFFAEWGELSDPNHWTIPEV